MQSHYEVNGTLSIQTITFLEDGTSAPTINLRLAIIASFSLSEISIGTLYLIHYVWVAIIDKVSQNHKIAIYLLLSHHKWGFSQLQSGS